ncbi:MAG: ATP-dependent zinc metalloprotease FtsH [Cyclobacteriaceae bacterium]|nr:ATP-dependent zinc metalloprotease FtsH [Cyclobacteriaceae bacterium]MCH8514943.1 ATP-dependent zinc metalloprotease FtsH [Cyclobacteriaceae bacterium]
MAKKQQSDANEAPKSPKDRTKQYWIYLAIFGLIFAFQLPMFFSNTMEINSRKFEREMLLEREVDKIIIVNNEKVEVYIKESALDQDKHKNVSETSFGQRNPGPHYTFTIGSVDYFMEQLDKAQAELMEEDRVTVKFDRRTDWFSNILSWLLPLFIIVAIWIFIMRRASGGGMGGNNPMFNVGKSKALLFEKGSKKSVTFDDIAGLDEAKQEIMEVVDLLKNPEKYQKLGAKVPKGALLTGPPGTGKTMIAKAMANEAEVPFFSISGSDFVEMFVGVGAARVRDLFKKAKEKAPCIIFIDEIEAIGRSRSKSNTQTNDERENTLNQMLVEMDGFNSDEVVIVLAATNRPDLLDKALMRPGRFDRQIVVDKPDLKAREAIFKVHMKNISVGEGIDAKYLAEQTPGFAGAEIANVCNEAALFAAREGRDNISMKNFNDAIDRVIGGLERKNKLISKSEKKRIAYHEAGHAIAGWFLENSNPLVKVSIIPRGAAALGYAQYLPKEQYLYTKEELLDNVVMTLAGRAAEEVKFGNISTGAQNDLEKVTNMVYSMLIMYGMDREIGQFSFNSNANEFNLQKPYSEATSSKIDETAKNIIEEQYKRAISLLKERNKEFEKVATSLLEKEVLTKAEFQELVGQRAVSEVLDEEEKSNKESEEKNAKNDAKNKEDDANLPSES